MSYNSNTKIITAPVSIRDVQQAVGSTSRDLATLCLNTSILLTSKYKPTGNASLFTDDWWQGMSTGSDPGAGSSAAETTSDYYVFWTGMDFAGIWKPFLTTSLSITPGGLPVLTTSLDITNNTVFRNTLWQLSLLHRKNTSSARCVYRLPDFKNYVGKESQREDVPTGMSGILSATSAAYYVSGSTINISTQITHALRTLFVGNAELMGLNDIFGVSQLSNISGKAYFGIIVAGEYCGTRGRLTMIYISSVGVGDVSESGLQYLTNISIPTGSWIATEGSKSSASENKFYPNETIAVIPIIARQAASGKWFFCNLNYGAVLGQYSYTIPEPAASMSPLYFSTIRITMRVYRDSSGNHVFCIQNSSAVYFIVATVGASGTYNITFANSGFMQLGPSDGGTTVVETVNGILGATAVEMGRTISATNGQTITQTSAIISNYEAGTKPLLKLKPYSGITQYGVTLMFYYYRPVSVNGTLEMHKFMATANNTFNVSDITTSAQNVDFIFTQKDVGSETSDNWTYYFGVYRGQTSCASVTLEWSGSRYSSQILNTIYSYRVKNGSSEWEPVNFSFSASLFSSICYTTSIDPSDGPNAAIGAVATLNDNVPVGTVVNTQATVSQSGSTRTMTVNIRFTLTS